MTSVPLTEARNNLSGLLDDVERTRNRITITRHGKPVAVLMAPDDLEGLEESLEIALDPVAMAEIAEAQKDFAEGRYVTSEEMRRLMETRMATERETA